MTDMTYAREKIEPPPCDGWNHPWSFTAPIYCKGCGIRFTDVDELEREIEFRKRGLVEDRAQVRERQQERES
jgi:hypothetical protein